MNIIYREDKKTLNRSQLSILINHVTEPVFYITIHGHICHKETPHDLASTTQENFIKKTTRNLTVENALFGETVGLTGNILH